MEYSLSIPIDRIPKKFISDNGWEFLLNVFSFFVKKKFKALLD